jgi:hypothetical protein
MRIIVGTPAGAPLNFEVTPKDTVRSIKDKIAREIGVAVVQQKLVYNGQVLNDPDTLEKLNIPDGAALRMTPADIPPLRR